MPSNKYQEASAAQQASQAAREAEERDFMSSINQFTRLSKQFALDCAESQQIKQTCMDLTQCTTATRQTRTATRQTSSQTAEMDLQHEIELADALKSLDNINHKRDGNLKSLQSTHASVWKVAVEKDWRRFLPNNFVRPQ